MATEIKPMTYLMCDGCDKPIPYSEARILRQVWRRGQLLDSSDFHIRCVEPKCRPPAFGARQNVRARHQLIVSLHDQGLSHQECAETAGLYTGQGAGYHIRGKCRCHDLG